MIKSTFAKRTKSNHNLLQVAFAHNLVSVRNRPRLFKRFCIPTHSGQSDPLPYFVQQKRLRS